jgi:osmotically-inducible protein OsmY
MGFEDYPLHQSEKAAPLRSLNPQIAEEAEIRLRNNSYLALKNVSCEHREGVLTLRGCLPTYYLKQMAQATVARLAGVQRIVNEIEVIAGSPR